MAGNCHDTPRFEVALTTLAGIKALGASANKTVHRKVGGAKAKSIAVGGRLGPVRPWIFQLRATAAVLAGLGLRELVVSSCASSTRFNIAACAAFGSEALTASYTFR